MICPLCSVPKHSIVILNSTATLRFVDTNWLCSSFMTLPCASAIVDDTFDSSPGLSGKSTDTVKMRSRKISPCCTTEDMVMTSMLPPLSMATMRLSDTPRCFRAATESSPEFSTIILWFSTMSRKATTSSSSSTVMMSSRFFLMYGKISVPGVFTAVPSAMVSTLFRVVTFPAAKDACIQFAPAGSTPMTLILGFSSLASVDTPVASPPPPIGTRMYSTSGRS